MVLSAGQQGQSTIIKKNADKEGDTYYNINLFYFIVLIRFLILIYLYIFYIYKYLI